MGIGLLLGNIDPGLCEPCMSYLLIGGGDGLQDDSLHLLASSQTAAPPHLPQTQQSQDSSTLRRTGVLHLSRRDEIQQTQKRQETFGVTGKYERSHTSCMRPATVPGVSLGQEEHRAATQRATEWYDCLWRTAPSAEAREL